MGWPLWRPLAQITMPVMPERKITELEQPPSLPSATMIIIKHQKFGPSNYSQISSFQDPIKILKFGFCLAIHQHRKLSFSVPYLIVPQAVEPYQFRSRCIYSVSIPAYLITSSTTILRRIRWLPLRPSPIVLLARNLHMWRFGKPSLL